MAISSLSCALTYGGDALPMPTDDIPKTTEPTIAKAVFAGGCFWCTEAVFEKIEGVKDVVSGYAGDKERNAKYDIVSGGNTGHAEAIEVTYDASKVTYGQLLRIFFAGHDPTQKDRQGPDTGRQYRSAIFFASPEQKRVAGAYIRQLDAAKAFERPIVTTLEPLEKFFPAEDYHQDFARLHPNHPYILRFSTPKVDKITTKYGEFVKGAAPATQPATKPAK